jgi:Mannosyl-glycoprotein endo-beta-N-acetylglucosaminidase
LANPPIIFSKLTDDQAHQIAQFYSDQGAAVVATPDGSGTFTVQVTPSAGGPTGGQTNGSGAGGGSLGAGWQQLAMLYKSDRTVSDSLKVATLAQWALESGRGTGALAMQHLNFAGMKYRDRMAGFAVPVTYTGTDGETTAYCKFASLDAFVAGYWHFIQSGPYTGWQRFNDDPAGFIGFIAPNYAADPQYPQKVAALFDEARGLLALAATVGQNDGGTTPAQPVWTQLRAKFLNKRTSPIQGIVLHDTAGNGTHGDTLYLNDPQDGRKVSVDFTVEKDGSIFKLNPDLPSFYCNHAGQHRVARIQEPASECREHRHRNRAIRQAQGASVLSGRPGERGRRPLRLARHPVQIQQLADHDPSTDHHGRLAFRSAHVSVR